MITPVFNLLDTWVEAYEQQDTTQIDGIDFVSIEYGTGASQAIDTRISESEIDLGKNPSLTLIFKKEIQLPTLKELVVKEDDRKQVRGYFRIQLDAMRYADLHLDAYEIRKDENGNWKQMVRIREMGRWVDVPGIQVVYM